MAHTKHVPLASGLVGPLSTDALSLNLRLNFIIFALQKVFMPARCRTTMQLQTTTTPCPPDGFGLIYGSS